MDTTQGGIQLSPEEQAQITPFFLACDERVEGFRLGMEQAKRLFVQHVLSKRAAAPPPLP